MRLPSMLAVAVALGSFATPVRAADAKAPSDSVAQADQLFRDARSLLDQGRYNEACRLFERSGELDPSTGTLLNLGNCYEQEGDLARALATFERAIADSQLEKNEAKRKAWTDAGSQRRDLLLARVPVLNLTPSPTPGASVRLDGTELFQARGQLRLNPGLHSFEVSAPGKRMLRRDVELHVAERLDLVLPALEDTAITAPVAVNPPEREPLASSRSRSGSALPWVVIGSGALVGAAGVVTALMAKSKEHALDDGCRPGPVCSDPSLRSTRDSGEKLATATYLLWAAGGAGMAVGFTLLALDQDSKEGSSEVSVACIGGACGLQATGSF